MRGVGSRSLVAGMFAIAALLFVGGSPASGAGEAVVFSVDSARVPVGASSQARLRVSARAPGVAAFYVDVKYDATALEMTGCEPAAVCNVDPSLPNTVRFAGLNLGGYMGDDIPVGTLIFKATGAQATTRLAIDQTTLDAEDPYTKTVTNLGTEAGTVAVVDALVSGDVNCNGSRGVSDALADLRFVSTGKFDDSPGCTPPGNLIDGKVWGDENGNGAVDAHDALDILLLTLE
jgi:hypothetical protein